MRKHLRRPVLVLVMSAIMVGVMVAPAGAAQKAKNTGVVGEAVYEWSDLFGDPPGGGDVCPALDGEFGGAHDAYADFTMNVTGDLDRCWYTLVDQSSIKSTPSGAYSESGVEVFIRRDGNSSFETTYNFSGKFETTAPFAEIHGRCQPLIVAGSGTGIYEDANRTY